MKIISKFKDFYDHIVAKYGIDERLVYERKCSDIDAKIKLSCEYAQNEAVEFEIYIGEYLIYGFKSASHTYTSLDLVLPSKKEPFLWRNIKPLKFQNGNELFIYSQDENSRFILRADRYTNKPLKTARNFDEDLANEPILIRYQAEQNGKFTPKIVANPNLSKFGIFIDPEFIWQSLVEFLSKQKSQDEISRPLSDSVKIQSHGFDKKRSFRPKIKS
ncbi:hypothetical protein [Campylobacter suis]|uniref:Uncharacterized protein n=1 Tax=Campylobacter suis TaxID=2790657 RepID=A0ABN7K1M5_9BACT|nr:hypothetical protein [Campylobacter suis]CAD7286443.1 hypothetical protein LMG8286_00276 [Campylobacter suis]